MTTTTGTTTTARAHDFTLDELQAYDEGTLVPDRALVVARHLAAGCPACRAWIANSHEVGRLLHADAGVGVGVGGGGHMDDPDAFLWDTPRARARRWLRRRLRPRRFVVLLVVLPLKGRLVRHLFRTPQGWEARASAVVSLAALTVATLRFVFARPSWPTAAPTAHRPTRMDTGTGVRGGGTDAR
jgi:anti-sigma factor RsiW